MAQFLLVHLVRKVLPDSGGRASQKLAKAFWIHHLLQICSRASEEQLGYTYQVFLASESLLDYLLQLFQDFSRAAGLRSTPDSGPVSRAV